MSWIIKWITFINLNNNFLFLRKWECFFVTSLPYCVFRDFWTQKTLGVSNIIRQKKSDPKWWHPWNIHIYFGRSTINFKKCFRFICHFWISGCKRSRHTLLWSGWTIICLHCFRTLACQTKRKETHVFFESAFRN